MAGVEKSLLRVRSLAHEFQTHPSWKNIQFALLSGLEVRHVWGSVFSGNSSHRGLELEMEGMQEVEDGMRDVLGWLQCVLRVYTLFLRFGFPQGL